MLTEEPVLWCCEWCGINLIIMQPQGYYVPYGNVRCDTCEAKLWEDETEGTEVNLNTNGKDSLAVIAQSNTELRAHLMAYIGEKSLASDERDAMERTIRLVPLIHACDKNILEACQQHAWIANNKEFESLQEENLQLKAQLEVKEINLDDKAFWHDPAQVREEYKKVLAEKKALAKQVKEANAECEKRNKQLAAAKEANAILNNELGKAQQSLEKVIDLMSSRGG